MQEQQDAARWPQQAVLLEATPEDLPMETRLRIVVAQLTAKLERAEARASGAEVRPGGGVGCKRAGRGKGGAVPYCWQSMAWPFLALDAALHAHSPVRALNTFVAFWSCQGNTRQMLMHAGGRHEL